MFEAIRFISASSVDKWEIAMSQHEVKTAFLACMRKLQLKYPYMRSVQVTECFPSRACSSSVQACPDLSCGRVL